MTDAPGTDQTGHTTPTLSAQTPRPPGVVRWLRRRKLATAIVLLVTTTLAVRLWWQADARRRLEAVRNELRAAGQIVDRHQWDFDVLPASENAAILLGKAEAMDDGSAPSADVNTIYPPYFPMGEIWEKKALAAEASNQQVLSLVRQARQLPKGQMYKPYPERLGDFDRFQSRVGMDGSFTLRGLLTDAAMLSHLRGDDVEAVERLRDILHIAAIQRQSDSSADHIGADAFETVAAGTAMILGPGLRLKDAATRQCVEQFIQYLIRDDQSLAKRLRAERFDFCRSLDWQPRLKQSYWALTPLVTEELIAQQRESLRASQNVPNLSYAQILKKADEHRVRAMNREGERLAVTFASLRDDLELPSISRSYIERRLQLAVWSELNLQSIRRYTAVALAVQLFRADESRWPKSLSELTPKYLAAIPDDPYAPDQKIGYLVLRGGLPDGSDRPLLYVRSGPEDETAIDVEPMYFFDGERSTVETRQYRDLARWLPKERRIEQLAAKQEAERQQKQRELEAAERAEEEARKAEERAATQPSVPGVIENQQEKPHAPGNQP